MSLPSFTSFPVALWHWQEGIWEEREVFVRMYVRSPCSTVMALGAEGTSSGDSQSCCAIPLLHELRRIANSPLSPAVPVLSPGLTALCAASTL